jgi:hypothetical protein
MENSCIQNINRCNVLRWYLLCISYVNSTLGDSREEIKEAVSLASRERGSKEARESSWLTGQG